MQKTGCPILSVFFAERVGGENATTSIPLHPRNRECPRSGATPGPGQVPLTSDRIANHHPLQSKGVATGRSGHNRQLKSARDISIHVPAQNERPGLGPSRSKAGGRRQESQIRTRHRHRAAALRQGGSEGKSGSPVRVRKSRTPIAGNVRGTTRTSTSTPTRDQHQTQREHGYDPKPFHKDSLTPPLRTRGTPKSRAQSHAEALASVYAAKKTPSQRAGRFEA